MIITIFGATGMVGKQLVKQALIKGHHVRAFGRNVFTAGFDEQENLELLTGALFDHEQVLNAVTGSDAVLSVLGGSINGTDKTRSLGIKNIVEQMQKSGVNRIIALGGFGILNAKDGELVIDTTGYPANFIAVGREHQKAYGYLKASSLEWTFVCAPDIINEDVTGQYNTAANFAPEPNNFKINSGDLAMFMLQELKRNEYIKQRVGISN